MRCNIEGCPGEYEQKEVIHTVRQGNRVIVIDHVPAEVCNICGDVLFTPETVRKIETLRNMSLSPVHTAPIYDFNQTIQEENIASREQLLLRRLEELWQYPHELSLEMLRRLVQEIPEEHQAESLETVAEYLVNFTKLHYLDIVATFYQTAELEDGDIEEHDEAIADVIPESIQTINRLGKQIAIRSLDDLVILGNITFGLYSLSQVNTADAAERWLYKFPRMYRDRLEQEHLLKQPTHLSVIVSAQPNQSTQTWNTVFSQPSTRWVWNSQGTIYTDPHASKAVYLPLVS